ncbi:uncharacterized protein LOC131528395 [Onychostoma macrolepis]|uniref:uncharacterized protein LOC131528395 n=1 Tax=Onychostoma macrolepis TaxID=369639 RepID=UPI00272B5A77|nr:uncharacterized protein LOC131528395 [Onychostoma macrolepis]
MGHCCDALGFIFLSSSSCHGGNSVPRWEAERKLRSEPVSSPSLRDAKMSVHPVCPSVSSPFTKNAAEHPTTSLKQRHTRTDGERHPDEDETHSERRLIFSCVFGDLVISASGSAVWDAVHGCILGVGALVLQGVGLWEKFVISAHLQTNPPTRVGNSCPRTTHTHREPKICNKVISKPLHTPTPVFTGSVVSFGQFHLCYLLSSTHAHTHI